MKRRYKYFLLQVINFVYRLLRKFNSFFEGSSRYVEIVTGIVFFLSFTGSFIVQQLNIKGGDNNVNSSLLAKTVEMSCSFMCFISGAFGIIYRLSKQAIKKGQMEHYIKNYTVKKVGQSGWSLSEIEIFTKLSHLATGLDESYLFNSIKKLISVFPSGFAFIITNGMPVGYICIFPVTTIDCHSWESLATIISKDANNIYIKSAFLLQQFYCEESNKILEEAILNIVTEEVKNVENVRIFTDRNVVVNMDSVMDWGFERHHQNKTIYMLNDSIGYEIYMELRRVKEQL